MPNSATWADFCCCSGVITTSDIRRFGAPSSLRKTTTLLLAALFTGALALPSPSGAATRRTPTLAPSNTVVDGPSAAIASLGGLAVARDGSGGLVYLKNVGSTPHVFVSPLVNGSFQAPVQIDAGLPGGSTQPVIAAANGGQLVMAFINGGELYGVSRASALSGFTAPVPLLAGAGNPSISMSPFGKAYVAFTATGQGGHDVRSAYYYAGNWGVEGSPLDANPADDAGTGTGRPDVATAGDGTAIVVWGEAGHVYSRRVLGTSPSIVDEQADPGSVQGWGEVSATDPSVAAGGDSSYAAVAFAETVSNGTQRQTRVVVNRLVGSQYVASGTADGLSPLNGADAGQPNVAVNEFGSGFVTADNVQSNNLLATTLANNEVPGNTSQVNSQFQQSPPDAAIGVAGTVSTLVAWQQDPGSSTTPEIRVRYAPDGVTLNPELVVSSPALGPTDAGLGLFAAGDLAGDAAIAWVQGTGSQTRILAGQMFQAPGGMTPVTTAYSRSVYPSFNWSAAAELWGPPTYVVKSDGVLVATTTNTSVRSSLPLSQGRHVWQVTALNRAGLTNVSRTSTVFVDSLPPRVTVKYKGERHVGTPLRLRITYSDIPVGMLRAVASGVASIEVKWGDASKPTKVRVNTHDASHIYKRKGHFTVSVTVKDKAGNKTVRTKRIKIKVAAGKTRSGKTKSTHGKAG